MTAGRPGDLGEGWNATRVLDAMATAVIVVGADLQLHFLNPAAETLLNTSRRQAIGRRLSAFLRSADELAVLVGRALRGGAPLARNELRLRTQERERVVDCRLDVVAGNAVLIEMLDAEQRLRHDSEMALIAQQSVGRTMGRQLAHEIRNPLAGLRGAAQLLERRLEGAHADYTRVIVAEADRLSALVERVLGPGQPARRSDVNVHELLHRVCAVMANDAAPGVTIVEDYDPSLPLLSLDRDQIIQALLNLGRNGLQAIGGEGTLCLRTRAETGYMLRGHRYSLVARIDVEDDGPGVPDEIVETLFYPLVTGRADGTGIGLALAQELINRHDGLVQLRSARTPTLFSVYLPVTR